MKLIDLLVKILPGIGGWPDDCIFAAYQDGYVKYYIKHKDMMVPKPFCLTQLAIVPIDFDTAIVTRDQYQSALAASQKVEWSGDALPPAGCECESKQFAQVNWTKFKVVAVCDGHVFGFWGNGVSTALDSKMWEFRPLRSESDKKRDAALDAIYGAIASAEREHNRSDEADKVYEAIAAGKIPGVKLED